LAASFAKELRLWIRDPKVFAGSMLAPLVVLVVFYLLFGRIPSLPVALVNLDKGPHSATLVELFQTVESPFGDPYLDVRLVGASEAQDIFRAEEVVAVLTIPDTFTNDVEGARRGKAGPDVDLLINNINSDMAKNIRLYLTQVIGQFYEQVYDNVEFTITEDSTHGLRVPWFTEIGLGVVIFSISLAGMFNASSSLLREFQENTIKELLLAPRHMSALLGGKALLALAGALASGGLMYAVVVLLSGQPTGPLWLLALATVVMLGLTYTAVGFIFGLVFKRYIPAAFCSVLTGFVSWFLGGALGPVARDGSLAARVAVWLPTSHATTILRSVIIWQDLAGTGHHLVWLSGLLLGATVIAAGALGCGLQTR